MRYKVHIQDKGWSVFFEEGRFAGTVGESKRIEAIVIEGVDEYRVLISSGRRDRITINLVSWLTRN